MNRLAEASWDDQRTVPFSSIEVDGQASSDLTLTGCRWGLMLIKPLSLGISKQSSQNLGVSNHGSCKHFARKNFALSSAVESSLSALLQGLPMTAHGSA